MKDHPLIDQHIRLEKYAGKGGWTYAPMPGVSQDTSAPFGWVQVRGRIDNYELRHYKLMPMGEGRLFLPVKKAIRKAIAKEAGDMVHVVLYLEKAPLIIPEEILDCLRDEPLAFQNFMSFTEGQQKAYLDWVNAARRTGTKIERIAELVERAKRKEILS